MKNKPAKSNGQVLWKTLSTIFVFYLLFCMIISPAKYISKSLDGISAWALNVLPSVLPFMFFTRLLSSLDTMSNFTKPFSKLSTKLFHTPPVSICTFFMAILSGYPVGTKLVADMFLQGKISKSDAFKMTSFCSTSGPMFIIGAVGVGMFKSAKIGYILFISHILGAVLNGMFFRNLKLKNDESNAVLTQENPQQTDIGEIVLNSTLSILCVGCIITIFFLIIEALSPLFNLFPNSISAFLQGLVEITKGCQSLSLLFNQKVAVVLSSFVVSFGGISTIIQSITMLAKLKMPTMLYVAQKMMHGFFFMHHYASSCPSPLTLQFLLLQEHHNDCCLCCRCGP